MRVFEPIEPGAKKLARTGEALLPGGTPLGISDIVIRIYDHRAKLAIKLAGEGERHLLLEELNGARDLCTRWTALREKQVCAQNERDRAAMKASVDALYVSLSDVIRKHISVEGARPKKPSRQTPDPSSLGAVLLPS